MTPGVEHLFVCLSAICVSYLVKQLFQSRPISKVMPFIFLFLHFESSLHILETSPVSDSHIFPQYVVCLFVLLLVSLQRSFSF